MQVCIEGRDAGEVVHVGSSKEPVGGQDMNTGPLMGGIMLVGLGLL